MAEGQTARVGIGLIRQLARDALLGEHPANDLPLQRAGDGFYGYITMSQVFVLEGAPSKP